MQASAQEYVAQIRITNTITTTRGVVSPRVLSIKASKLADYIEKEIRQCNKTYTPNRSKEYEHLPLLALWDLADTGEQFVFDSVNDLPKQTVFNSKGIPVLIIIPEKEIDDIGLNKFQHLTKSERVKVSEHLKNVPVTPFRLEKARA